MQKPLLNNYWETLEKTGVGVFKTINEDSSFQSNILEGHYSESEEKLAYCTVKPMELIKKLILTLVPKRDDNIILDPFAGSGTTLAAAQQLGYHYTGIEIESDYVEIIKKRLAKSFQPMLDLSLAHPITVACARNCLSQARFTSSRQSAAVEL